MHPCQPVLLYGICQPDIVWLQVNDLGCVTESDAVILFSAAKYDIGYGLLLRTEVPLMTHNGIDFVFASYIWAVLIGCGKR